ncbi:MAG TPA: FAD:protein FMN transferase [Aquificaceae bacterium]|nr:FAD:protein FMN transferase [Aquificaceae bacterium]
MKYLFFFLFLFTGFVLAERIFYLMGTYLIVDELEGKEIKLYKYMKSLEEKLSHYMENSEISKINRNAGVKAVKVSEETFEVLRIAFEIAEKTEGFFDPTVGSYTVNYKMKNLIPLQKAKSLINYRNLVLNEKERKVFLKKKLMALDLGGIGKGYAIEKAYQFLNTKKGFLALAGDMKVWGHKRILAIYNPLNGKILAEGVNKGDLCLSTSGNYFRKHIIGKEKNVIQVTVAHQNCTIADALATALFSAPEKVRKRIMKKFPKAGVLILFIDGSIYIDRNFKDFFEYLILR